MNAAKAREFFSAYYEGELTNGLKESFERSLVQDPALKAEYEEFCHVMSMLAEPMPDVEVPSDLHETIMQRLDHHAWQEKENQKVGLFGNWRLALFGGLGALAIIAGMMSLSSPKGQGNAMAGLTPSVTKKVMVESVDVKAEGEQILLDMKGKVGATYQVKRISDQSVLAEVKLGSTGADQRPLANDSTEADAFVVVDGDGKEVLTIVVPGTQAKASTEFKGSVLDLAKLMADVYRTPILVRAADISREVELKVDESREFSNRTEDLKSINLDLSLRQDGISILNSF
jgi:hypothetical protein